MLWLDGVDLRPSRLVDRRAALDAVTFRHPVARLRPLRGRTPWDDACRRGWEGVIAKRLDAPYEGRRSKHWLKMKCDASQELVVGGFTEPRGTRVAVGALLVGYFEGPHLVYAGKVGTGMSDALLAELRGTLDALRRPTPPFSGSGLPRERAHWVSPQVVVHVAFSEWTVHGKLRHPRLLGVRADTRAADVVREQP